jgi:hypothetical protein
MKLSPATALVNIIKINSTDYLIDNQARISIMFGVFINYNDFLIKSSFPCNKEAVTSTTCPTEVFFEGFENPVITSDWQYIAIPGWQQTGPRLPEIQAAGSVPSIPEYIIPGKVHQGAQFLELDSDANTSISKEFNFLPGNYQVRFFYRAELWNTMAIESHGISLCVEGVGYPLCTNSVFDTQLDTTNPVTGHIEWLERVKNFRIINAGTYRLTLRATGISDSHGGQVDSLRVLNCL